jgi:DNA polymerase III sliding clamp (beta) subunit (PCNA family)
MTARTEKFVVHGGFYIKAGELKAAVERFKHVVPEKSEDKILEHLLMYQMKDKVELRGSTRDAYADCEIHASFMVNVEPVEGSNVNAVTLAVPYEPFTYFLKSVREDTKLKCVHADNERGVPHLLVESEYGRHVFPVIPSWGYPTFPHLRPDDIVFMKLDAFRDMIARTLFAADDAPRSKLAGVYFDFLPDKTRFVATNKYILSMYESAELEFPKVGGTKPKSMIVPIKALQAFMEGIRGLESGDEIIIYPFEQYIMLAYGGFTLSSTLLSGPYPDYERVVFKERPYVVSLKREELINEMKELLPFADKESPIFHLSFIGDRLDISVENTRRRMRKIKTGSVFYESVERTAFAVRFNAKQLLRILENIRSEYVVIKVESSSRPVVILPEPQNAKAYVLCLISPVVRYF